MTTKNVAPKHDKIGFKLKTSAETIRALFKNIPIPTFVWQKVDGDFILVDYNDAAMEITNGKIAEILGIKVDELYPDIPEIHEELLNCFNQKTTFQTERLYRFKTTGEIKHLSVKYVFVPPDLVLVHTENVTLRKQTEEQLKDSERRYRELANLLPQTIYETDEAYNITYSNQAGFESFGYTQEDLQKGLNIFELIIPEEREKAIQNVIQVMKGQLTGGNEYTALRKDGTTFPATVYSSPIIHNGKAIGLRGIVIDISKLKATEQALKQANNELEHRVRERIAKLGEANEMFKAEIAERKHIEEILRQSEDKHRAVVEQSADFIYLVDVESKYILEANPTFQKFMGYSVDELQNLQIYDIVAHDRDDVDQKVYALVEGRQHFIGERKFKKKDGTVIDVEVSVHLIVDNGKKVLCGVARDITQRKRMEEILRQSEEKYRAVVEQSADFIFLVDVETKNILEANHAFQKLLGYSVDELKTIQIYDIVAHDRDEIDQNISIIVEKGQHFIGERKYKKKDGTLIDVEVSTYLIINSGKKVICSVARDVTDRKRVEEALVERKRFIENILNSVSANLAILNKQGEIVYVNKSWMDFGHSHGLASDLVGENYLSVCDRATGSWADESDLFSANIRKVISGEQDSFSTEYPYHSEQGQCWFRMSVTRFSEPGPVYVVVAHINITKQKLAEEALQASERRYRSVVEDQTELICRHLPDGTLSFANESCCRFLNKKREEIIGKISLPSAPEGDLALIMKHRLSLTFKKPIISYEHQMIRSDGKIRWFHRTDRAIFDEHGVIQEYQSVARDITARKRAEEELEKYRLHLEELVKERTQALILTNQKLHKELLERKQAELALQLSKRRYELLYEENPSMYFTIDLKGKILSVNKLGAEQLGYSVAELIGKSIYTVIYKEDRKIVQHQLQDMSTDIKKISSWEFRKVRKDGTIIWIKESARHLRDDAGKSLILIVCEDITDKINAQNEREKLSKELAEREKLAILGQLTATITHEINNPLDIIMTEIDALQEDYHHLPELLTCTNKIKEQVFRINRLAGDILSYAKPQPPELLPVDVNKILSQTLELLRVYHRDGLKIETKLKPNLPLIPADAIGLEIVFKNIILNAIQSFKQEGKINIETQLIKDDQLRITIKDNGTGIEKSRLKKIFEQFYTSKQDNGGTGLGLAISSEIVKKHYGTINIKSQLGEGTTFSVNLPVRTIA